MLNHGASENLTDETLSALLELTSSDMELQEYEKHRREPLPQPPAQGGNNNNEPAPLEAPAAAAVAAESNLIVAGGESVWRAVWLCAHSSNRPVAEAGQGRTISKIRSVSHVFADAG